MNTQKDLSAFIGKTGTYQTGGLTVNVKIVDARLTFGRVDLFITPVSGLGQKWTMAAKVKIEGV